ncbi:MAG: hypothetical protein A3D16_18905 [Rhodobacterales bacterium RIFCSPHIGHO2_02_FULL_62_130]|nr:MAG: hypothetical protein A3D16_18905 [Rhodobacterales bacterium RIFCSPHIGHO2_02_FULL_62_130]OHC58451.1 MAG: hypothetical protein A3E48_01975 [Rhodobacterales bacterium RIFCSPHIGHO2_12_FULL_62_75]
MRRDVLLAAVAAVTFSLTGFVGAEDLSTVSDVDLLKQTREAVGVQDADLALELLTEMQRRGTGIFTGAEKVACEESIDLPAGITDWRFKGAARQAYITSAKKRQLANETCGCLFTDYPFEAFTTEVLGKSVADLTDADRAALEVYLAAEQRDVEGRYRALEKSCRTN